MGSLDFNEYESDVKRTFSGESRDRLVAGMAEELGEIAQVLKKYRDKDLDNQGSLALCSEIGDLIRYACLLAVKEEIPLGAIVLGNMNKMRVRRPVETKG